MNRNGHSFFWSLPFFIAPFICYATQSAPAEETIVYRFEDFEQSLSGVWHGRPEASGQAREELASVHGGRRAQALVWDFSKSPDANNCFANFVFHRELVGRPQAVRFWMHATANEKSTPLVLWIADNSGEMYISRAAVDWTGWKQVTIPVATSPAWNSGDQNRKHDLPMKFFGLAVDAGGPKTGTLILDDIDIVTRAIPRESLLATVESDRPHNLFWDDPPELVAKVKNFSSTPVKDLRFDLTVTDTYTNRKIWQGDVSIPTVAAKSTAQAKTPLKTPYGLFRVDWQLRDSEGTIRKKSSEITRMMPKCFQGLSDVEKQYLFRTSPFGGVFWQATPEQGGDTGARWIRNWINWQALEPKPGQFQLAPAVEQVEKFLKAGIASMWFATLYGQPESYVLSHADYAPAYGRFHRELANALDGRVDWFELGNEDNGPSKFLYTEVARHGAAGIRAANPLALVANSGTAFVDLGWLRMQAQRGIFDRLDALCVHPYTTADPPEKWGVYEQARLLVDLADELGGTKQLWTTEFGWPETTDEKDHADWVVRHFLIGVAAGYDKHGLYAWDGHFGIYDNGRPLLPAVSTHAMCKLLEGYRFAGILERQPDLWAVVWEKFGKPIVIAWSPTGDKSWSLDVGKNNVQVLDLFGNPLTAQPADGKLTINLTSGPQYVVGGPDSLTDSAWSNQLKSIEDRIEKHKANAAARAVLDVRYQMLEARMGRIKGDGNADNFAQKAITRLQSAQQRDTDLPKLRWALHEYQNLDLERRMAQAAKNDEFARRLQMACTFPANMDDTEETFFAVWPYLYTLEKDGKTINERLRFVPGVSTEVKVRVNNYARNDHPAELALELPTGFKCDPVKQSLFLKAGQNQETSFFITCPKTPPEKPVIHAVLKIPAMPEVRIPFDNIEIAPLIQIEPEPLEGLLPTEPLRLRVTNLDAKYQTGTLRLFLKGHNDPLAQTGFTALEPGRPMDMVVILPNSPAPDFNEWPITAEFTLADGRTGRQSFAADFLCTVRAEKPPAIDGNLDDWKLAAPIHIDQAAYAKGSFGLNWSPEDLSGTTYTMWDEKYFYFAAVVRDQTFNQNLTGEALWSQDSIQLAFAKDEKSGSSELGLALTPKGEEIFRFTGPTGTIPEAKMKVLVSQGQIIYEAAIPWTILGDFGPIKPGFKIRYSLLLNDDDAVIPRRFLERFGGIAHNKNISEFGRLILIDK